MKSKVKLTKNQNIKPVEKIKLEKFLTILIPSRLRGSTAKAELVQKSRTPEIMSKYLKCIINHIKVTIVVLATISSTTIYAKNFGVQGHTYSIYEQSFLKMIDERLQDVDVESEKKKIQAIAREKVEEPTALDITAAKKTRSYQFDPTYTLDKDIILPCGSVAYKAGTTVNPLDYIDFDRKLIFINTSDKKQVAWLKKYLKTEKKITSQDENKKLIEENQTKIILTGGRPLDFEEEMQRKIYFDQSGMLTNQLKIKHVPSIVVQDGKLLKITEIGV